MKSRIFLACLVVFGVSLFARDGYRRVGEIAPEVLQEPIQTPVSHPEVVRFTQGSLGVEITPVARYEISGLIVGRLNYSYFATYDGDKIGPVDVSMIWGTNVENGVYRTDKFSNDMRAGIVEPVFHSRFNWNQHSNNHLITRSWKLYGKARSLRVGDQVTIRGSLVNTKVWQKGKEREWEGNWNSSTTRTDTGSGACEVIDVQEIEILRRGHPVWNALFFFSSWGLVGSTLGGLFALFRSYPRSSEDMRVAIRHSDG